MNYRIRVICAGLRDCRPRPGEASTASQAVLFRGDLPGSVEAKAP